MSIADAVKYGTVYTVNIISNDYETDSDLETISVGDAPLNVEGHKITGELPWSYTVPTEAITNNGTSVDPDYIKYAMNAEFVLSKYAALRTMLNNNDNYPLYSNGDSNDDGSTDNATTWDGNNMKFLFVRNQDGTVSVYRLPEWYYCRGGFD